MRRLIIIEKGDDRLSKSKKEKLIQNTGAMSQAKVKSYEERQDNINQNIVAKGKDITHNQL